MAELLELHPKNPQVRFVRMAVDVLLAHGVIVYPTDSCYALGCLLGAKDAMERIQRIRQTDKHHFFTLVCRDLREISRYARVDNPRYRLLKAFTPGPYTFVLEATREVPRRLMNEKRRTVGIRVPEHPVVDMLLSELGEPIMSTTLILPGDSLPMTDAAEIHQRIGHAVDLVLDGGNCGLEPTTVVDLAGPAPAVLRAGKGDPKPFQ
jgi:tRNA threonylcarbamoyl adenosine modification protein (Sua5/YciO/YrdC/YwlC family)